MQSKLGYIRINKAPLMAQIKKHFRRYMKEAEDQLIKIMREEILVTIYGDGPGKPEWREAFSKQIKVTERRITNLIVESDVGLKDIEKESLNLLIRAMIITEGSGSEVGNPAISAGPNGRLVWDSDLSVQGASRAKSEYLLPDKFNQEGNDWLNNSVKLITHYYEDIIRRAWSELPSSIFYGNTVVVNRR